MSAKLFNRASFQQWARAQPRRRFERLDREVIAMSPERWQHARLKAELWRVLDVAVTDHPNCRVVPGGMTVAVDDDTDFEPDVTIHCGPPIPPVSLVIPSPVVVIEALSPSTTRIDTTVKVELYLKVATHYLIFRADRREVTHWRRGVATPDRPTGRLALDPPGVEMNLDAIYQRAEAA